MAIEDDPRHVVCLALVPVCCRVESAKRIDMRMLLLGKALDPYTEGVGERPEVVDQLETLLAPVPVHGEKILQHVERQCGIVAQEADNLHKTLAGDRDGKLPTMLRHLDHLLTEMLLEPWHYRRPDALQPLCKLIHHLFIQ